MPCHASGPAVSRPAPHRSWPLRSPPSGHGDGESRRGCKLGTAARARRRPGAPRNGRTEDPKGGRYFKYRPPQAPLVRLIGVGRPRLGASQQASSSSGTDLLSWAGKAADHGASETALARMLDRECNRRDFGCGEPRDERRAAAHSFPAAAPYWPNKSTQSLSVTQCQIRGSELGPQRPWRFWSLRRRTTLFSFHGLLICSFTCAVCCGEARLTAHGIS